MPLLRFQHVASGSFVVTKRKPLVLQAFLGTCVAVAICDTTAEVGGLIHVLLPEQITPGSGFQAEKYASTGLPLFIDALVEAGADVSRMKAWMAGGALVGPVSQQDLALDIGGRTAEICKRILASHDIPILNAETGGFFSCCMNFNVMDWECAIEPAGESRMNMAETPVLPEPDEISSFIERVKPVPQIALKVLRMMNDGDYAMKDLAAEVRKDQVIGAKILYQCNTAYYGLPRKIDSINKALTLLGSKKLFKLIISTAVNDLFADSEGGYSLCKGGLYYHALGCAVVAEQIARFTGQDRPSLAYTAGLLHDIGKIVMDQFFSSAYPLFYRTTQAETESVLDAEMKILGVGHTEVGLQLAKRWDLPESLVECIAFHHHPEKADKHAKLAYTVYLADLIMSRFLSGLELERIGTDGLQDRMQAIGMTSDQLETLIDQIPQFVFSESVFSDDEMSE